MKSIVKALVVGILVVATQAAVAGSFPMSAGEQDQGLAARSTYADRHAGDPVKTTGSAFPIGADDPAYQDQISGYGGIKHCLIPSPKHVIVGHDKNGKLTDWIYAKEQTAQSMLKILGYM